MPEGKLFATLRTLCESDIQYIVVGGLAAVLNGAPVQTYDVDVIYSRDQANVDRLNLLTRYGPVDLLATIGQNLGYSDLLPHSTEMVVGEGLYVRVLDLETLISIKEQLATEKDVAVLPILRQTLRETKKKLP
jgi:predicted nucleotidyltransferase